MSIGDDPDHGRLAIKPISRLIARLSQFLFMAILAKSFFALMGFDFMSLALFTTWHIFPYPLCDAALITRFLNSFDGLNTGIFLSGTGTTSPVRGFRALRAFRGLILNVPNPLISMLEPFSSARLMASRKESTVAATSVRG